MVNVIRFAAVLAVFVVAVTGVVWTTAATEQRTAERRFAEREAAGAMVCALLARESALRGYAQATRASFLEPYDEATASLAERVRPSSKAHGRNCVVTSAELLAGTSA
ncbi:MAG: hypothetical protein ABIR67_09440 [Gaiellaceae bacterium]